ncbi:MAG: hypothetical protein WDN04_04175 [Rhodospirillales bacterium]
MTHFSWPVAVLALVTMLAGAVVGDALRAAAGGSASQPGGGFTVANTQP